MAADSPTRVDQLDVPVLPKPGPAQTMEQYGLECATVGIFDERAAVLRELDLLAREFDAAGRPNTARRVRQTAEKIDARLRESSPPAPFAGS
jgi:hypothetical protein